MESTPGAIERALDVALAARRLDDVDQAGAALARVYAQLIDADMSSAPAVGPKLLTTLDALTMTPRSRGATGEAPAGPDHVDELQDRRERRRAAR